MPFQRSRVCTQQSSQDNRTTESKKIYSMVFPKDVHAYETNSIVSVITLDDDGTANGFCEFKTNPKRTRAQEILNIWMILMKLWRHRSPNENGS